MMCGYAPFANLFGIEAILLALCGAAVLEL